MFDGGRPFGCSVTAEFRSAAQLGDGRPDHGPALSQTGPKNTAIDLLSEEERDPDRWNHEAARRDPGDCTRGTRTPHRSPARDMETGSATQTLTGSRYERRQLSVIGPELPDPVFPDT